MTENKLAANRRNLVKSTGPETPERMKRKFAFLVLTIGLSLFVSGCSKQVADREIPKQFADQIRQAIAERDQVLDEATNKTCWLWLSADAQAQKKLPPGIDKLFDKAEDLDQRIRMLKVEAIREAGLDPLRYTLDSTNLRPQLRTVGEPERLAIGKWMAERIRPLLDERRNVEDEMTSAAAWLNEFHSRLSYLKGAEYSKTEAEIPKFQARYDQLMPRLRELNERTNQLSSDVILATGHDPAWYELPTASTKEGVGHAPKLEEDRGQFYLVVYLKVPPAPTLWEQVVARLGFRPGPQR